jgi:hypothetical protein
MADDRAGDRAGDKAAIIELINLYGLAMDTRRWDLFDRIFTQDCDADYGPTAHWTGRAQFKSDFGTFHLGFDATQHVMTNHLVTVDGDRANSLTYGMWRLIRHAAQGDPLWDGTGWYDDEWVRTGAGWRIARRVCKVVWATGNPKVQELFEGVKFELVPSAMSAEAAAGNVGFLNALDKG